MRDRSLQIAQEPLHKSTKFPKPSVLLSSVNPVEIMDGSGELIDWNPSEEELQKLSDLVEQEGWEVYQKLISKFQWLQLLKCGNVATEQRYEQGVYAGIKLSRGVVASALRPKPAVEEEPQVPEIPRGSSSRHDF